MEELSGLVYHKRALELLDESRRTRGSRTVTRFDMNSAIVKTKVEGALFLSDSGVSSSQLTTTDNTYGTPECSNAQVLPSLASPQYAASLPPATADYTMPKRFDAQAPPSSTSP